MAFTPTTFVDDSTPAITAKRLNDHQDATKANESAISDLTGKLTEAEGRITSLLARLDDAEAKVTAAQAALADTVKQAEVTSNATPNTIAKRGSQSQVAVSETPPFSTSATSKKYVDSEVKKVADRVTALEAAATPPAAG